MFHNHGYITERSFKYNVYDIATTFKGAIMEMNSTRLFNGIPATIITGVFNFYLSNLLCKLHFKHLFIDKNTSVTFQFVSIKILNSKR